jgi:glycosyltransferase involved in cell wall biosynthesis
VVRDFKTYLPSAEIHVYDNASSDATSKVAREAGAIVHYEGRPGKGGVVRRMFSEIEADIYVMADGDGTYDAAAAPRLVRTLVEDGLDMVVGRRREAPNAGNAYPPGHRMGNALLTGVVQYIFGQGCMDMLSGYRVCSRRYVKSFPVNSRGFEIETEMTVHALDLRLPVGEVNTLYDERDPNSQSKLRTLPDGIRILAFVGMLVKEYKPATFFGMIGAVLGALAILLREVFFGVLVGSTSHAGAVATVGVLGVAAVLSLLSGMILDSVSRSRREVKRMVYLNAGRTTAPPDPPRARWKDIGPVALSNITESR